MRIKSLIDNKMLIICDHKNKELILCDLKTTGHPEYEFASSFLTWNYSFQGRLHSRVIAENIGKELSYYLSSRPRVPNGIDEFGTNNIVEWINKL